MRDHSTSAGGSPMPKHRPDRLLGFVYWCLLFAIGFAGGELYITLRHWR